jgi:DNA-binding NtrC family response regulator
VLIGASAPFLRVVKLLERFAGCDAPVLIEGETGTGKELAARFVHYGGARRSGPFVPLNCGAIPDSLFENELFGHDRGAFTDAHAQRTGFVGLAREGTIFLDEIDSLSHKGQVALLRFLQDNTYRPLGGGAEQRADVRVIAAANVSLDALAERGAFRRDLLFRIKLLFVEMPPLRERHGDVPLLAEHFVAECSRRYGVPRKRLGPHAIAALERHRWPGNVRELENVVHRGFLLSDGPELDPGDVLGGGAAGAGAAELAGYRSARDRAVEDFHRRFLGELLLSVRGNLSSAARRCGADRRMLGRLVRRYKIDLARFRDD